MANSVRYRELCRRINKVARHFLPKVRANGDYTAFEQDKLRAYRLLIHAELEAYFEGIAIDILDRAVAKLNSKARITKPLAAAVGFCSTNPEPIPAELSKKHSNCFGRIKRAVNHFQNAFRNHNNGIKESNILALLLPVGVEVSDLDATLINTLNSFGASRGAVAHTSAKTQKTIDPVTEQNNVSLIVKELAILDERLNKL